MLQIIKKIYYNFKFDVQWILSDRIGIYNKLIYLFDKYSSIASNKKSIFYLRGTFYYDNRFTPALLEQYPSEILRINRFADLKEINSVLDIGANVGQWAFTLKSFYPKIAVYSFEPNKNIFNILKTNSVNFDDWKIYPYAISLKTGKRNLYYSPEASAEGSFYEGNVYQNYTRKHISKISVNTVKLDKKTLAKLKIPKTIDLLKIDVEGAEFEVLQSISEIKFRYLYVEVSVNRKGDGDLRKIMDFLNKNYRDAKILNYHLPDKKSPCAEVIIKLNY